MVNVYSHNRNFLADTTCWKERTPSDPRPPNCIDPCASDRSAGSKQKRYSMDKMAQKGAELGDGQRTNAIIKYIVKGSKWKTLQRYLGRDSLLGCKRCIDSPCWEIDRTVAADRSPRRDPSDPSSSAEGRQRSSESSATFALPFYSESNRPLREIIRLIDFRSVCI